jgi:hypothetical protein
MRYERVRFLLDVGATEQRGEMGGSLVVENLWGMVRSPLTLSGEKVIQNRSDYRAAAAF